MRRTIFATKNVKAIFVPADESKRSDDIVVGFMSNIDIRREYTKGESEGSIKKVGRDAIHVIPSDNTWYQYAEIHELLACIKDVSSTYNTVAAYGLSMGGFAALRASAYLNADFTLTYSPQYSVNRERFSHVEDAWHRHVKRTNFIWEDDEGFSRQAIHTIVYDPFNTDRKHVDKIREYAPVDAVKVPFGGHHVWRSIGHAGWGQRLMVQLLKRNFNERAFRTACRVGRRDDFRYFVNMAKQLPRRRAFALDRAFRLAPYEVTLSKFGDIKEVFRGSPEEFTDLLKRDVDSRKSVADQKERDRIDWNLRNIGLNLT